jgi:peptide/nickel transport system substrate-binding protein
MEPSESEVPEPTPAEPAPREAGPTGRKWKIVATLVVAVILVISAVVVYQMFVPTGEAPNQTPIVRALANKETIDVGEQLLLDGTNSEDPDGEIVAYEWDLGDGRTAEGELPTVAYDEPGSILIVLTVTDDAGAVTEGFDSLVFLRVLDPPREESEDSAPTAVVIASTSVTRPGVEITLNGSASWAFSFDGAKFNQDRTKIASFAWDFGDGNTSTAAEVTKAWTKSGSYAVKLTVTAANGKTATAYNTILVLPEIVPYAGQVPNPTTYFKAVVWEPAFIDPVKIFDYVAGEVLQNVYDKLLTWDRGNPNKLVPALATEVPTLENGGISSDGLTYTFTIRQGVKFHDGSTLTPEDVEYTFERLLTMNPPGAFGEAPFIVDPLTGGSSDRQVIDQAVEVSGNQVVFTLRYPYAPFLQVIAGLNPTNILSKNYVIANGGWDPADTTVNWTGKDDLWMQRHAMGTGPYKLVRWDPNQRLIFEAHDAYWRGTPTIKKVVLIVAPEASTRIALIKAGDVDQSDVTPQFRSQIEGAPGIKIVSGGRTGFIHFTGFSQNVNMAKVPPGYSGINATFFSDINVRKGFNYAMPYEDYIETAYKGLAVRYNSPIPPPMWANDPEVPLYPYDPAKAAEQFKLAWGGTLDNPGPVWQNGFSFTLYHEPNDEMQIRGEMLAASLKAINPKFDLKVQVMDVGPLIDLYLNNALPMWMFWWGGYFWDPDIYAQPMMHSLGWRSLLAGYSNATVDALIEQASQILDQQQRYELYKAVQWAAYYDVPVITMEQPLNFVVFRDWISGYIFNPAEHRQSQHWDELTKG